MLFSLFSDSTGEVQKYSSEKQVIGKDENEGSVHTNHDGEAKLRGN